MSNVAGTSSGSSNFRRRVRFVTGVPEKCWCGVIIVAETSNSKSNPFRRYFRCAYAVNKKLENDNHIFKWVDEALLDEVSALKEEAGRLHEDMKELITETMKQQKMAFENLQKELEKEIIEKVEDVFFEAKAEFKSKMNKMMILMVFGCLVVFGLIKLVG